MQIIVLSIGVTSVHGQVLKSELSAACVTLIICVACAVVTVTVNGIESGICVCEAGFAGTDPNFCSGCAPGKFNKDQKRNMEMSFYDWQLATTIQEMVAAVVMIVLR